MVVQMERAIISGMFRSGTTHLWKLLSADLAFEVSYCEPLHPRLDQEMLTWDHYKNYQQQTDLIRKYWSPDYSSHRLLLGSDDSYPQMADYLRRLLAPHSLAKFVRLTLRLGWFARIFPDAFVINIVRDPRAVCFSMLHRPDPKEIICHDLPWEDWHARQYFEIYSQMPPFRDYLLSLQDEPPYVKILALWRINVERSLLDLRDHVSKGIVVRHEDVCLKPEKELRKIYEKMGIPLPPEVLNAVRSTAGSERPWQQPTTTVWMDLYKQVDSGIWRKGIRRADIGATMDRLGYEEKIP